jgi:hypothetical protein
MNNNNSTIRRKSYNEISTLAELLSTRIPSPPSVSTNSFNSNSNIINKRGIANVAMSSDPKSFFEDFFSNKFLIDLGSRINSYNHRSTANLNCDFLLVRVFEHFLFVKVNEDNTFSLTYLENDKTETKYAVLLGKIMKSFETSGFRICSATISKKYILYCLENNPIFVIGFGMHKKTTKLSKMLDSAKPQTKLDNLVAYDLLGFVFVDKYKKNHKNLYIDVICSNKSFGDILLTLVEYLGEYMLYDKMYLSAVDTALSYYLSRKYTIIINKSSGKQFKYMVDPKNKRGIKEPIEGSKELTFRAGMNMVNITTPSYRRSQKKSQNKTSVNNSTSVRRSGRIRSIKQVVKKVKESGKRRFVLNYVSFDSDSNINMVKELAQLIE